MKTPQHPDAALIESLGGPTCLAKTLGYLRNGTQRVHNWTKRGIPPSVKLNRPDLFLKISPANPWVEVSLKRKPGTA